MAFDYDHVCYNFKKIDVIRSYFSNFYTVVNGFRVWFGLKFLGIPCCAWSDIAVSVVVGHWGDVCFLEDDIQASLSVKRVCIKTIKPNLIHDKLMVVVQGISYELVVRELSN